MIIMIEFDSEILGLIQAHLIPKLLARDWSFAYWMLKMKGRFGGKKSLHLLIRQKCLKEYGKHVEVEMRSLWVTICNYWIVMCLICNPQRPHFNPIICGLQSSHYNPIINLWVTIMSSQSSNLWLTIISLQSNN